MIHLKRVDGPECHKCGCQDSVALRSFSRWGKPWEQRRCEFCGTVWSAAVRNGRPEPPVAAPARARQVVFRHGRTECPKCKSTSTAVTSTRAPIRHHKCRDCKYCFKSVES